MMVKFMKILRKRKRGNGVRRRPVPRTAAVECRRAQVYNIIIIITVNSVSVHETR
jgi:hypothetical protein